MQNDAATPKTGQDAEQTVSVVREELQIGKKTVEKGQVAVYITPQEHTQTAQIELAEDQIDIERIPMNRPADKALPMRQ